MVLVTEDAAPSGAAQVLVIQYNASGHLFDLKAAHVEGNYALKQMGRRPSVSSHSA